MGEVSVTSASQILESLWNMWSQVTQEKKFLNGPSLGLFNKDAILAHGSGTYTLSSKQKHEVAAALCESPLN